MIVILQTAKIKTLADVESFLAGNEAVDFQLTDRVSAYQWLSDMLKQFRYNHRSKPEKGLLRRYASKVTGFSRAQIARLLRQYRQTGHIKDRRNGPAKPFNKIYTDEDIRLLAETDALHHTLSGPTTRKLCERMYAIFGDRRFERLARISNGHLYNLRQHRTYQNKRTSFNNTRPVRVAIGERRKPFPNGKPGYLRVDSVHQGDLDGIKGLYLITAVDEVTQFECVFAVERISEHFLLPTLAQLLETFPFVIRGFHSDNGSEYINQRVAKLLEKLRIEQTKSRPRQSNDNALVESKNGSTVRKHLG